MGGWTCTMHQKRPKTSLLPVVVAYNNLYGCAASAFGKPSVTRGMRTRSELPARRCCRLERNACA
jgi:hypothetical protein